MKLQFEKQGRYLLIHAEGRLDSAWAEFFKDELLLQIRNGEHDLVIEASGMIFLSSAGIRSLLLVFKELKKVQGSFMIAQPTEFVTQTLTSSGFKSWLSDALPEAAQTASTARPETLPEASQKELPESLMANHSPADSSTQVDINEPSHSQSNYFEHFTLNPEARLDFACPAHWKPWSKVTSEQTVQLTLGEDLFALGIASSAHRWDEAKDQFGEFAAVAGNVAYQPATEEQCPDFLLCEQEFVPQLTAIQALVCQGQMGQLLRFTPAEETLFFPISTLLQEILNHTAGQAAGFVLLAEIEGLVGSSLIRSPGLHETGDAISFPELREWISFCGDRSYPGQQALVMGVVAKTENRSKESLLSPLSSQPHLAAHLHAVVFPYQPLQNGQINLKPSVDKFFAGPPPLTMMHLLDDNRPATGLGESAFFRGACWFNPLHDNGGCL